MSPTSYQAALPRDRCFLSYAGCTGCQGQIRAASCTGVYQTAVLRGRCGESSFARGSRGYCISAMDRVLEEVVRRTEANEAVERTRDAFLRLAAAVAEQFTWDCPQARAS